MKKLFKSQKLQVAIRKFDGCKVLSEIRLDLSFKNPSIQAEFAGALWNIKLEFNDSSAILKASVLKGTAKGINVSLELVDNAWTKETFLMLPAAAYNGNRFKCRRTPYPPKPVCLEEMQENPEIVINDVPRLNINDNEPSQLHITTGDETTPCISWFNPAKQQACILLTKQHNEYGNFGIRVTETNDRSSVVCAVESPVVRSTVYSNCRADNPSPDHGIDLHADDCIEIPFLLIIFPAKNVQNLYTRFAQVRKDFTGEIILKHCLPFSAAWKIQEEKLNRDNWNDPYGYYAVGTRNCWEGDNHNVGQDWQPGWTGGGINSLALLAVGDSVSRERAMKTLNFMFTKGQADSGLLLGLHHQGKFYDDTYHHKTKNEWVMIRKNTDALYFALKHLIYLRDNNKKIPTVILSGVKKLADCLYNIYKRYGQFGQFFDVNTGEMLVGGTTSGALGAGALALAGQFFDEKVYIEIAMEAGLNDYKEHVKYGVTTGGPGEILQAPDSESAFAMLESLIVLYEVTGDKSWLPMAVETADQCMTWCASYDYEFPAKSIFGEKDIRAAGSVWANVQNKHSSPGICTFSGDSLLKLYRATGEKRFLELITEIAHNLTQYMVRKDHLLGDMKEGWICERVNFSDWEGPENIGGNMFGSCWPEVSLALTVIEVPGIYIQTNTKLVCAIDHIDAEIISENSEGIQVRINNPCVYDATVKVLAEDSQQAQSKILGQMSVYDLPIVSVPAGEAKIITVAKNGEFK